MNKLITFIAVAFLFASCGPHSATGSLSSASPDGKTVISVNGKKPAILEPFTVTMEVKTNDKSEGSMKFEVAASVLDTSDVKFDWMDSQNCLITFIHTDGEKRVFRYYATATTVMLREEGK